MNKRLNFLKTMLEDEKMRCSVFHSYVILENLDVDIKNLIWKNYTVSINLMDTIQKLINLELGYQKVK